MPAFPIPDIFEDPLKKKKRLSEALEIMNDQIHRSPEKSLLIPTRMQTRREMWEILGIGGNILPEESFLSSVTRHTTAPTWGSHF